MLSSNIDNKYICNRKIVIEIRFVSNFSIIDKRGQLLDSLLKLDNFKNKYGSMNMSRILAGNGSDEDSCTTTFAVYHNRISYISSKIDSVESFYSLFDKAYQIVLGIIGNIDVLRIGCRTLGTYTVKENDFNQILHKFIKAFPNNFFFDDFEPKDLCFQLQHDKGMYRIGPINKNDNFLAEEFSNSECKKHVGIAIDADNFITNSKEAINDKKLIKDVYLYALSVEKTLYERVSSLF
jgi:hypothetical protein